MDKKLTILYISVREPHLRQGPTYSVPAQIAAQTKYDNVLWLNLVNSNDPSVRELFKQVSWKKLPYYKDLSQGKIFSLDQLPEPFNKPDLIIFEQFYVFGKQLPFICKMMRSGVPYIIIPRGELTTDGQRQNFLKKKLGNLFFFSYFARHAAAIEYLTEKEKQTSGTRWNKTGFAVPNGISLPDALTKTYAPEQSIKLVYIGRLSIFHKGLDLMLQACRLIKDFLLQANVSLDMYGPDLQDFRTKLQNMIQTEGLQDIVHLRGALYKEDKFQVLRQADIFVMTSRFEGHPMGLIEALAYGLPCVATTGTNMREEIDKFDAGWTADNTVESIAAALTKMLKERDQFAKKSQNARTLAAQYDWDKIAQQSHQIYEEIVGEE